MDWKTRLNNEVAERTCQCCGKHTLEVHQLSYTVSDGEKPIKVRLVLNCVICGEKETHTDEISRDKKLI